MGLIFTVADLQREIKSFSDVAASHLAPGSTSILRQSEADLERIARSGGGAKLFWQVNPANPIRTVTSHGKYMPGERGSLHIHAEIAFKWGLEPVRRSGDTRPAKEVRLTGIASTAIRLLEGEPGSPKPSEVAAWRMEIADDASPGAYFHVQVLGRDEDELFPKALDVPRLPGMFVSPFACTEFVISELFQEDWVRTAARDTGSSKIWRSIQAWRSKKQLEWHIGQVGRGVGTPWVAWKKAIPPERMFVKS